MTSPISISRSSQSRETNGTRAARRRAVAGFTTTTTTNNNTALGNAKSAREVKSAAFRFPWHARAIDGDSVRKDENECVLNTYGRAQGEVMVRGRGVAMWDSDGKEYLDFTAGIAVNCLGHADEGVAKALARQSKVLSHTSNLFHTEPQATLARKLVNSAPFADRVFFCNSGTEANEAALKFSRKYAKVAAEKAGVSADDAATETVSFKNGFHGRTMGALSLTWKEGYRKPFAPLVPGNTFATYGDLDSAAQAIVKGKTCAVFVEPVQGEGGIYPADAAFLRGLRKLCDDAGALLVYDEVQCGLGRTGKIWGHQLVTGAEPDLLSVAKPLANGLPIGVVLMRQKVADVMVPGDHGSTFAGGPLVCAAANEVFDRVTQPAFLANVEARGEELKSALRSKLAGHPRVKDVRGAGLLVGVQFDVPAAPLVAALRKEGLLTLTAGAGDVLRLVPPLIVNSAQVQKASDMIAKTAFDVLK